ncbi:hypothetical protein BGZ91_004872, partial [Linnemannia elongata]
NRPQSAAWSLDCLIAILDDNDTAFSQEEEDCLLLLAATLAVATYRHYASIAHKSNTDRGRRNSSRVAE